jgi:hypothetical protein
MSGREDEEIARCVAVFERAKEIAKERGLVGYQSMEMPAMHLLLECIFALGADALVDVMSSLAATARPITRKQMRDALRRYFAAHGELSA